jgi:hypothetical protein
MQRVESALRTRVASTAMQTHDVDRHARLRTQQCGAIVHRLDIPKNPRPEPDPLKSERILSHGDLVIGTRRVVRPPFPAHDLIGEVLKVVQREYFGEIRKKISISRLGDGRFGLDDLVLRVAGILLLLYLRRGCVQIGLLLRFAFPASLLLLSRDMHRLLDAVRVQRPNVLVFWEVVANNARRMDGLKLLGGILTSVFTKRKQRDMRLGEGFIAKLVATGSTAYRMILLPPNLRGGSISVQRSSSRSIMTCLDVPVTVIRQWSEIV